MSSYIDERPAPKLKASRIAALIVGACLVVVVIVGLSYWFALRPTTGANSTLQVAETIPTTDPDEATRAALIVLDGATQLRRDPGAFGSYSVAYSLNEKYPASNAIQQISAELEAIGWTPLKEDWLNPGMPSSHIRGWTDFVDGTTTPRTQIGLVA